MREGGREGVREVRVGEVQGRQGGREGGSPISLAGPYRSINN